MKDISELMLDRLLLQAEKLVELKFAIENIKSKFDTNLVDRFNYKVIFKPESIVPDVKLDVR